MDPRALVLARFHAAVAAVEPAAAVRRHLRREGGRLHCGDRVHAIPATGRGRVVVIGAGKASAPMAQAVEAILDGRIDRSAVVVKHGHMAPLAHVRLYEAGHPVPDADGLRGTMAIEAAVADLTPEDLVICCLSGGASALLPAPRPPLTLTDERLMTSLLLGSGVDIRTANVIRKHLSRLKGGRLALACAPATVLTLAISDVIGDDPALIGSGPTVADPSSDADALDLIARHLDRHQVPDAVRALLAAGTEWTPKPGDPRLARAHFHIVASNALAIAAVGADATGPTLSGEAREAAEDFCRRAVAMPPGSVLAAGGETTVTLGDQPGRGGRNQEFALAAARWIARHGAPLTVLAAGTDGNDGPTDAAGGIVDGTTWNRIADPQAHLDRHDAYTALRSADALLVTGPTNTNVMDLAIAYRSGTA